MDLLKRLLFSFFIFWSIVIAGIAAIGTFIGLDKVLDPEYSYYDGTLKDPVVIDKKLEISDFKYIYVYSDAEHKHLFFKYEKVPLSFSYNDMLLDNKLTLDQKNYISFLHSTDKFQSHVETEFLLNKSNPDEILEVSGEGLWTSDMIRNSFTGQRMGAEYTISCDSQYDDHRLVFDNNKYRSVFEAWGSHQSARYNSNLSDALKQYCVFWDSLHDKKSLITFESFEDYKKAFLEVHNNIDHGFDAYIVKYWNVVRVPRILFGSFISFTLSFFVLFQLSHLIVFGKIRRDFKFS